MKNKEEIKNILFCKKGYENYHYLFISFFIVIIIINPIQIVNAENGYLNISVGTGNSYNSVQQGANEQNTWVFNKFAIDVTDYNKITRITLTLNGAVTWGHVANSGSFSVNTALGNNGTGTWTYDSTTTKLEYYFIGATIISTPIILIGTMPDITQTNNALWGKSQCGATISSTRPIEMMGAGDVRFCGYSSNSIGYNTQTQKIFSNFYDVTYPNGLAIINITKSMSTVVSKIEVRNNSDRKYIEPTFNTSFLSYGYVYDNGLILKMYDSNGNYDQKIINTSVISDYPPNIFNISFNKSFYNLGEQTNISYTIGTMDLTNNFYRIKVYNADDMLNAEYTTPNIVSSSGFVLPAIYDKNKSTGFYAKLYSFAYDDASTYYANKILLSEDFVSYGINISNVVGNISTDKSVYNTTETITIKYNSSVDGRIRIKDGLTGFWFIPIISGNNQEKTFYISTDDNIGTWQLLLQYYLGTWDTINSTTFTVNGHESRIDFDKEIYNIGDTINIISFSNVTGYVSLFDSNNVLRSNYTVTTGISTNTYYLHQTVNSGTWNIYLYNNTGDLLASNNALIQFDVIVDITPTPTIPQTQIDSQTGLIDIGDSLAQTVFGKIDSNNDYEYSDSEISHVGNKIFSTILLIAFVLLLSGSYYALKNKRR